MSLAYKIEMAAWVVGMALNTLCILRAIRYRVVVRRLWFVLWLAFDLTFDLMLYWLNVKSPQVGYPAAWGLLQPVAIGLLGMVVLETLDRLHGLEVVLLAATVAIGFLLPGNLVSNRRLLLVSALVCLVSSMCLAIARRGFILMIYTATQTVQHLAVLYSPHRWHAGTYAELLTMCCFAAWLFREDLDAPHKNERLI